MTRLRFVRLVKLSCDLPTRASYTLQSPHSPFSHLFTFAETLLRIPTNTAVMGLVELRRTHARMYNILSGPMGGARDGNVAVCSSRWHGLADWWVGRDSCGCSPTELARASCSWLGRHSTGAYAGTPWTPTPLQRAKPCAPPSTFSSLSLPPTFHTRYVVFRVHRGLPYLPYVGVLSNLGKASFIEFIAFVSTNSFMLIHLQNIDERYILNGILALPNICIYV